MPSLPVATRITTLRPSRYLLYGGLYLFFVLCSACTGLRTIDPQNPLLREHQFEIVAEKNLPTHRIIQDELESVVKPKPNSQFLWMRPGLSIYNIFDTVQREKGLRHWLKYRIGSPPVGLHSFSPAQVAEVMENRLYHQGHFIGKVTYSVTQKKRTAKVRYRVLPGPYYHLDTLVYPDASTPLEQSIRHSLRNTSLKRNDIYNLPALIQERVRIENVLKDSGFYYFDQKYLLFRADTTVGNHGVHLTLQVKPDTPREVFRQMRLSDVYVMDDVVPEAYHPDTLLRRGYHYLSQRHQYRPEVILDQVYFRKGDIYSRALQYKSTRRLMNLGTHQYVNISYTPDSASRSLDAYVYMNPLKKNSLSAELNTVVRTTNYAGPGVKLSFKDRNLFGGAELFSLNLEGSFESQIGADSVNRTYQIGLDASIDFPRLFPIKLNKLSEDYFYGTNVRGGFTFFHRIDLFALQSFYTNYGYHWQKNNTFFHRLNFIDVSFNRVGQETDVFLKYLENNPTVKRSFEDQFILGSSYSFTVDHLTNTSSKKNYYFQGTLDLSGNLAFLIHSAARQEKPTEEDPYKLLGLPYAQFARISTEFRRPFRLGRNQVATRIKLGYGIPWGNSTTLPYVRQFFTGGTNSIRAFVSRTVGPGSYRLPEESTGIDQTGDINIEGNMEYRFDISRQFKGALFLDAGNIWMKNEDPERAGAHFELDRFWKEFAIGSGFGLRYDIDIVVIRLDLAWPLHNPSLPEGERWVVNDIQILSSAWRRNNLLLNLGIGYPF